MSEYRVYKVSKALRQAAKADRLTKEQSLADYLQEAVDQRLNQIVAGLEELGIKPPVKVGACRWPVNGKLLAKLRKASDKTGIAASHLLMATLQLHSQAKPATKRKAAQRKRKAVSK